MIYIKYTSKEFNNFTVWEMSPDYSKERCIYLNSSTRDDESEWEEYRYSDDDSQTIVDVITYDELVLEML